MWRSAREAQVQLTFWLSHRGLRQLLRTHVCNWQLECLIHGRPRRASPCKAGIGVSICQAGVQKTLLKQWMQSIAAPPTNEG